ncbi:MAG: CDP-diacylglycerol--glycerol-3-phosphate 3-phosphatidyltransferase [Pseudomonadota bacterium]
MTLPTALTLLRIALLPIVFVAFYIPADWARPLCAIIFAVAGFTDWLDGYLARRLGQSSAFGAFLDPVADKLMVAVSLLMLVSADPELWLVLSASIIISREIVISALREWMAEMGQRQLVAVSNIGKIKTVLQMLAIFMMLYKETLFGIDFYLYGTYALVIAAALTLYSMCLYLRAAWRSGAVSE